MRLRSNATVSVINSGQVGDTIQGNVARFERDVLAHRPDLVVWQLGTNDVVWRGRPDQPLKDTIIEGVTALKAAATDVVLMDLQYAPMVLASSYYPTIEAIIADVAKQERVGLFSRFALMRNSIDGGVAQGALVSWDGIHTTVDVMIALAELLRELSQIAPVDRLSRRVQRGYPKCAKHQA